MASAAVTGLAAEGTYHDICPPDRHPDNNGDHPADATVNNVECSGRQESPGPVKAVSIEYNDTRSAAFHATPPMPSYSLRFLSFCVAILAVFAAHLHLASLSLLISRGMPEFPFLDHAADALPSAESVSHIITKPPAAISTALRKDFPSGVHSTVPQSNSETVLDSSSATASSGARVHSALLQSADTSSKQHTSFRSLPEVSQVGVTEQPPHTLAPSVNVILRLSRAGEAYVFRTITEVLKAPSPLPGGVPFIEDLLIAWHLLLQAIGCLLCGALADAKGRRWVLSHSVPVLGAASFVFTLSALSVAHLSRPSTGNPTFDFPPHSTGALQSGGGTLGLSNRPNVIDDLSESHPSDSHSIKGGTATLPIWLWLPVALPPFRRLTDFLPSLSSSSLWAILVHVLIFSSVACYSLAALACGGVVVVAQCLCLEAAAPFPLKSTRDADLQRCLSTGAQPDGNRKQSPAVCKNMARAGSLVDNDIARKDAPARADDDSSIDNRRENAMVNLFLVNTLSSPSAPSTRASELRSPLLAERQHSPSFLQAARNIWTRFGVRIRSFSTAFWRCCNRALSCVTVQKILSFTRTPFISVYKGFAPFCFFSSPYIPLAYLVGTQSAAYLFLPLALSTMLKTLSLSTPFSEPGELASRFTFEMFSPFALFCIAFSIPILPVCVLLCVLTSRFLRENPYFLFQRKALLQHLRVVPFRYITVRPSDRHLTIDINQSAVPISLVRQSASRTLARAPGRATDTATVRRPGTAFSSISQRRRFSAHLEKRDNAPPSPLLYPSLSLPVSSHFPSDPHYRCSGHFAYAGQRQQRGHPPPPFSRMAQRRRAFSCKGGDHFASPRQQITARDRVSSYRNAGLSGVPERRIKTTRHDAYDDVYLSDTETARESGGDETCSLTTRGSAGHRDTRRLNVQLARTAVRPAGQGVTDEEIHASEQNGVMSDAERSSTGQQYEAAERHGSAPRSTIVDAVWKSLRVYQLYLNSSYSTSLRGVMLPAAFIGAAFYLRGIFRFLLLDCVVIEDEVEGGTQAAIVAARYTGVDLGINSRSNITSLKTSPSYPIVSSTVMSTTFSSCFSPPCPMSSPAVSEADPSLQSVSAEMLLFQLSSPVLLVRLCTCLAPMLFLSMLPPKPMQMVGCIFCAFMSFGIAVTLEALAQNFPNIPPISSAKTASLLYEMVFCCCCSIPAFTSILLPVQGFHTGVRCAFAATALACIRVAAAISLVGISVLLSYLPSLLYGDDSGGASTSVLEGVASTSDTDSVGGSNNSTCVASTLSTTVERPTSSNDACSTDAAITAVVTCVYYVVAAAFTLLYTTHIRLPRKAISPQVRKFVEGLKLQDTEPRNRIRRPSFDGEHGVVFQERFQSQSWITQWTENAQESTLLAVDNLLLRKLRPPAAAVCDFIDEAKNDDVESEAVSKY